MKVGFKEKKLTRRRSAWKMCVGRLAEKETKESYTEMFEFRKLIRHV